MSVIARGSAMTVEDVVRVARHNEALEIAPEALQAIQKCRDLLENKMAAGAVMYGVNTGIGELAEVKLGPDQVVEFQKYLIYSHAAGYGEPMPEEHTRAAILSRINVHCHGQSGLRPIITETLAAMLNAGVNPVMYQRGSVGACGDLSPMAQMALVPMGEGEAFYKGERLPGKVAMERAGVPTVTYLERDGLATINGSNVITGMGCLQVHDAERWLRVQEVAAALTLEVLNANMTSYDERLHQARGYPGAVISARNIRRITAGSSLLERAAKKVQDAYSLRSTPQVAGAARDVFRFTREMFEIELNGVGDNPVFFPDEDVVISGANFQGTPMALALESLGTAVTTVAALSERRLNRLMNPHLNNGLPAYLTKGAGMFSGLMLTQYTAGSLVAENRVLATPAATQSIPAAADQEDFVSMGMTTALKTRTILDHAYAIVGIELMAGAQAMDFLGPEQAGKGSLAAYQAIREHVDRLEEDRPTFDDINRMAKLVKDDVILRAVEDAIGTLE